MEGRAGDTAHHRLPIDPGCPTKLGNYYRDGQRYDVNGVTVQKGQGLHFWIANTTDRIQPGTTRGQEFWAYVFSWDPVNAAGWTTWNGIPFGASLNRGTLPGANTGGFTASDWVGTWSINSDGWRGTLAVTSAQPWSAALTRADGQVLGAGGGIDGNHPHVLHLIIPFAPDNVQPFQLYAHSWEKSRFSGITRWGGMNFGVQGVRTG